MTKYTFLLPAFKVEHFVKMLESLQHQTYTDFRVIISDDCAPEDIKTVCYPYLEDSRFSYRRNEENMGSKSLVSHWNKLVGMCDTEYLIMASDDDVYEPTFLEEIDLLVRKYPEVDLLRARAEIIDEKEVVVRRDNVYPETADQLEFMLQYEHPCHVTCVANYVFKTEVLKSIGGFVDYPLAWKSDTMTTNLMAKNAVANTQNVLFRFRVSGQNISSMDNSDVLVKKYKATEMKDIDMNRLLKGLGLLDLDELQKNQLQIIAKKHIERTVSELDMFAVALSFIDFFRVVRYFNQKKYFNSKYQIVLLWKKWLYYHTH